MSGLPPKKLLQLARDLGVPLEIVTDKLAILGQSGAGKTYTAMRLAELLIQAGLQVVILDLVGCWWGLRAGADGKRAGLPILVIGGQHGDLPLSANSGAALARLVVERRLSVVIDASELATAELFLFAGEFAHAFFAAKKRAPSPVHVLLEEAHELLAEDPLGKEGAAVHAAWVRICKLGRNYGIGYTLVSQEPQALSKRALGQVGTMIAMRTLGDYAQRTVLGWAKAYLSGPQLEALKAELPTMATGEAFIASPFFLKVARRDRITQRVTFDSSRTPEVGEVLDRPAELAPVEVQQLREQFAGLVEQLEQEDPVALQRRVAQLERELAAAKKAPSAAAAPKPVEVPVVDDVVLGRLEALHRVARVDLDRFLGQVDPLRAAFEATVAKAADLLDLARELGGKPAPSRAVPASRPAPAQERAHPTPAGKGGLSDYAQLLLDTVARRHPMKLSRTQISTLSGRSRRSSAFDTAMAELGREGLLEAVAGLYQLTAKGRGACAHLLGQAQSPEEIRAQWQRVLPDYERWLFNVLVAAYPNAITRDELAARAGKSRTSSAFDGAVSALKKNGLAVDQGGGRLAASADLFAGERAA